MTPFIMPQSTAEPGPPPEPSRILVERFGRKVVPRAAKIHWPQRHPISYALHYFPEGYPFKCVELGVYEGDHSFEMLKVLEPERLYLVDMWAEIPEEGKDYWEDNQEEWDRRYLSVVDRYAPFANVSVVRMPGDNAASIIPNDLDLVYIDANHDYEPVLNDMAKWLPKVRPGGIFSGDDYSRPQTAQAVVDFLKDYPQYQLQVSDNTTQWWFVKTACK